MKSQMIGFYRPSEDEFKEIWDKATFVLDANVLLNLYRYPALLNLRLIKGKSLNQGKTWKLYFHIKISSNKI